MKGWHGNFAVAQVFSQSHPSPFSEKKPGCAHVQKHPFFCSILRRNKTNKYLVQVEAGISNNSVFAKRDFNFNPILRTVL